MRKIIFTTMIAASLLTLTACSKKPSTGSDSGSDASQTYGVNNGGFETDSDGFRVNSLKAPSNQTYYFGFDNSDMRAEDMKALQIQANYIAAHPNARIRLEGNT